jgi:hypothetical protein
LTKLQSRGFKTAGSILQHLCGGLIVSKQKLKQAEQIQLIRLNREQASQTVCFSSRPFVLCGLPVRKLPNDQLMYERRNGRFVLQVTGHPSFGVPFGQDRLVPISLATLAVQQKSQTIRFQTAAEMLETFGMQTGGKEYRRLVQAFECVFDATIFFGTDTSNGSAKVIQRLRFNFMREAQIWYNRNPEQLPLSSEFENVIVLSDEFYKEILADPFRTISKQSSCSAARQPCSTCTCGSAIAAPRQRGRNRYRSSVTLDSPTSSAASSTAARDGFGACSSSG